MGSTMACSLGPATHRWPAASARRAADAGLPIEVEVRSLEDVDAALQAGAATVRVEGLPIDAIREAVRRSRGRAKVAVSGSVSLDRMSELAQSGAEYVSVAELTAGATPVEMTFDVTHESAS